MRSFGYILEVVEDDHRFARALLDRLKEGRFRLAERVQGGANLWIAHRECIRGG